MNLHFYACFSSSPSLSSSVAKAREHGLIALEQQVRILVCNYGLSLTISWL